MAPATPNFAANPAACGRYDAGAGRTRSLVKNWPAILATPLPSSKRLPPIAVAIFGNCPLIKPPNVTIMQSCAIAPTKLDPSAKLVPFTLENTAAIVCTIDVHNTVTRACKIINVTIAPTRTLRPCSLPL